MINFESEENDGKEMSSKVLIWALYDWEGHDAMLFQSSKEHKKSNRFGNKIWNPHLGMLDVRNFQNIQTDVT